MLGDGERAARQRTWRYEPAEVVACLRCGCLSNARIDGRWRCRFCDQITDAWYREAAERRDRDDG